MSDQWKYQVRVNLGAELAQVARSNPDSPSLKPLSDILATHRATIACQYDAFVAYVAEAEKQGTQHFPLYKWTKATIEDPAKIEKHTKSFAVYVDGDEVYPKGIADALELDLRRLEGGELVTRVSKHDTNPATNPQAPAHLR